MRRRRREAARARGTGGKGKDEKNEWRLLRSSEGAPHTASTTTPQIIQNPQEVHEVPTRDARLPQCTSHTLYEASPQYTTTRRKTLSPTLILSHIIQTTHTLYTAPTNYTKLPHCNLHTLDNPPAPTHCTKFPHCVSSSVRRPAH